MTKVLKITKEDKTVHVVPVANKAFYQAHINRLPADKKWKLEEIDEEEAKDLPFIDVTHVTGAEAVLKNKELTEELSSKDQEIAALKELLAKAQGTPVKKTADQAVAEIEAATTEAEVLAISAGDDRKTVIAAAEKKIAALKA